MQRLMLMPSMATMAMLQLPMVVMAMDGQVATPPSLAFTDMDTHMPTGVNPYMTDLGQIGSQNFSSLIST